MQRRPNQPARVNAARRWRGLVAGQNQQAGSRRKAAAALELVLSMPILLAIIVGVVWLGSSVIAQTEVTVEARHKAWTKRSEPTGTALLFLKDDVVSDEATKSVEVSPIFDGESAPESSHDLMVTSWDHESLKMDKAPNWKEYALAGVNTKTGSGQVAYTDARNQFTQFQSQAGNIWNTIGASLIRQLTNLGASAESALGGGKNEKADEARERAKIDQQLTARRTELRAAKTALRQLDKDASPEHRDVLKNKVKRLEAEMEDLKDDRKALS